MERARERERRKEEREVLVEAKRIAMETAKRGRAEERRERESERVKRAEQLQQLKQERVERRRQLQVREGGKERRTCVSSFSLSPGAFFPLPLLHLPPITPHPH